MEIYLVFSMFLMRDRNARCIVRIVRGIDGLHILYAPLVIWKFSLVVSNAKLWNVSFGTKESSSINHIK